MASNINNPKKNSLSVSQMDWSHMPPSHHDQIWRSSSFLHLLGFLGSTERKWESKKNCLSIIYPNLSIIFIDVCVVLAKRWCNFFCNIFFNIQITLHFCCLLPGIPFIMQIMGFPVMLLTDEHAPRVSKIRNVV